MMGGFRLKDDDALTALLRSSHVTVRQVKGRHTQDAPENQPAPKVKAPRKPREKKPKVKRQSRIEIEMELALKASGLPTPERHYVYFEDRNYTGDFVWPQRKVALEVDGGAHKTPGRFDASHERHYLLTMAGWTVIHAGKTEVRNGRALLWIVNALARTCYANGTERRDEDDMIWRVFESLKEHEE